MNFLKKFKTFERNISWISQDVNIRIDIAASKHAIERFLRHGVNDPITEDEIIDVVERSVEELTIALMQNKLNIEDRFILKDRYSDLHIVATMLPGKEEFTMVIITVMRKEFFFSEPGQYKIEV